MPIEENHDFLKQKQEHPTYPKRENLPEKSKEEEKQPEEQKPTAEKPADKKKKKDDDQLSLF